MTLNTSRSLSKRIAELEKALSQVGKNFELIEKALFNHQTVIKAHTDLLNDARVLEAMVGKINIAPPAPEETLTKETPVE